MSGEMALADELREYTAIKFAGDCKCGNCQLIPRELIVRIIAALRRPSPTEPDIRAALEAAKVFADDEFSYASDLNRKNRIIRLCDLIDAALSTAGDTGREPVAWQFQALSGAWNDCGDPDPRHVAKNPHRYRALYASPQPDARIGREEIARVVYDAFPFEPRLGTPHKPAWLPGGNSLMQDEARKAAEAICALTASAPAGGWQDIATIERCANVAKAMREKHGSPTGDAYSCGVWDQGVRIEQKIRALTARDAGSDVAVTRAHGKTGDARS